MDFLFADVEKVGETFRGDDFEGADLAEVAPVVTVRCGCYGGVVVSDVFGG